MSSHSADRSPLDALPDLFSEPEHPEAFPVYGRAIADVLPPEHFLWQLQGAYPEFDLQIRTLYEAQASLGLVPQSLWPLSILIPSDFYLHGIVIPQLDGRLPQLAPGTALAQSMQALEPPQAKQPPEEDCGVEPLGHSVSPEAEAFGAESVEGYDGSEEGYIGSEDEEGGEPAGKMPLDMTPDMYDEMASSIQSRIAAASWEVYKDVASYSKEAFQAILQGGPTLSDFFPEAFFKPFKSLSLWLSLAGQDFTMHGERCLGCFVYQGICAANGHVSLNAGFVSPTSYFDYSIPLEPHATIGYIIQSASEFSGSEDPARPPLGVDEKQQIEAELKDAWGRILPVIAHIYKHLPESAEFQRRKPPQNAVLRRKGMNSDCTRLWRWNEATGRFDCSRLPAILSSELRGEFLRAFNKSEENTPIEVAPDPSEAVILH